MRDKNFSMKNAIFAAAVMLATVEGVAGGFDDWVQVTSTDNADIYIKKDTIKRRGDIVSAAMSINPRTAADASVGGITINCATAQIKSDNGWKYIPPNTHLEIVASYLCK